MGYVARLRHVTESDAEGILITGVYGSGKSSVAAELAYLLEQRGEPYALLDLDYLGWADPGSPGRAAEVRLMLANLAAVAANYHRAGIRRFVLAWSVRDAGELQAVREAAGLPLRVAQLELPLADIEHRLASDVTTGRRDDLREAAAAIAARQGEGLADIVVRNDRPVGVVAAELLTFLGWLPG
jgi:hypothetical protein